LASSQSACRKGWPAGSFQARNSDSPSLGVEIADDFDVYAADPRARAGIDRQQQLRRRAGAARRAAKNSLRSPAAATSRCIRRSNAACAGASATSPNSR
jgi:hypothetical protein